MRIISGIFKGKKLLLPNDKSTRPLKDIVKESIFNLIQHSHKININIKSNQIKNNLIEIETSISLKPNEKIIDQIRAEVSYSTVVEVVNNISKENLKQIVLIEVPTKIYPELREAFIWAFARSGFKDIKVEKNVDFEALNKLKESQ